MAEITKLPAMASRPETGPMQFGDDWPGVFIRGDNALFFALTIATAERLLPDEHWLIKSQLHGIANDLRSCSVGDTGWPPTAL